MENINLIDSFAEFKEFKNIDRATLMRVLEDIFRNMLLKKYGTDENFDIIINIDKGDLEIWRNRTVIEDGEVENPNTQISLSDAKKIDADYEIGEDVTDEVNLKISDAVPYWHYAKTCLHGFLNWKKTILIINIKTKSAKLSWEKFTKCGKKKCWYWTTRVTN